MPAAIHSPSALSRSGAVGPKVSVLRVSLPAQTQPASTWLERLALWAERQPPHRHLGSWQRRAF